MNEMVIFTKRQKQNKTSKQTNNNNNNKNKLKMFDDVCVIPPILGI